MRRFVADSAKGLGIALIAFAIGLVALLTVVVPLTDWLAPALVALAPFVR